MLGGISSGKRILGREEKGKSNIPAWGSGHSGSLGGIGVSGSGSGSTGISHSVYATGAQ
jgi:hypothetical protein